MNAADELERMARRLKKRWEMWASFYNNADQATRDEADYGKYWAFHQASEALFRRARRLRAKA